MVKKEVMIGGKFKIVDLDKLPSISRLTHSTEEYLKLFLSIPEGKVMVIEENEKEYKLGTIKATFQRLQKAKKLDDSFRIRQRTEEGETEEDKIPTLYVVHAKKEKAPETPDTQAKD